MLHSFLLCFVAEAKRRLGELREESEQKQLENQDIQVVTPYSKQTGHLWIMQTELVMAGEKLLQVEEKWHLLVDEHEVLKEHLSLAQDQNHHLTHAVR